MNPTGPVVLGVRSPIGADIQAAMRFALGEARLRHVPLHVVHGTGPRHTAIRRDRWVAPGRVLGGRRTVGLVARQLRRLGRNQVIVIAINSAHSGVDALLKASESASLLILGGHRHPHPGQVGQTGSIIRAIVARADCPVVIVGGRRTAEPGDGVVVGVEEHGRAQGALVAAMEAAAYRSAPVTVVLAWDLPPTSWPMHTDVPSPTDVSAALQSASLLLAQALAGLADDYPQVEIRRRLVRGSVLEVLRDAAQHADLLVIGRHANAGLSAYALGHAARDLLKDPPCPVMLAAAARPPRTGKLSDVLRGSVPVGPGY